MLRPGRRWVLYVGLAIAGTALTIEAGLRATRYYRCSLYSAFPPLYRASATKNHEHLPNLTLDHCSYYGDYEVVYRTNASGDRVVPGPATASASPTAVVVGDSYAFGLGVNDEETFAAVWGERSHLRVVNRGVAGYTIDQEIVSLREALAREPATCSIVLQVTPNNDFTDLARHVVHGASAIYDTTYHVDNTGRLNENLRHVAVWKSFLRHWFLYRLLTEGRGRVNDQHARYVLPIVNPDHLNPFAWEQGERRQYDPDSQRWMGENAALLERYLHEADTFFAAAGSVPVTVVLLPVIGTGNGNYMNRFLNQRLVEYFTGKGATLIEAVRVLEPLMDYRRWIRTFR